MTRASPQNERKLGLWQRTLAHVQPGLGGKESFYSMSSIPCLRDSLGFGDLGEVHGPRGLYVVWCLEEVCTHWESQHPTGPQDRGLTETLAPGVMELNLSNWSRPGYWEVTEGLPHLGVAKANATQFTGYLQTKGPQLLEALYGGLFHLLHHVILGRIVHLLGKAQGPTYRLLLSSLTSLPSHQKSNPLFPSPSHSSPRRTGIQAPPAL